VALKRRRLAQRRKSLGHSQDDLASLVGVGRTTVVRWESAETDPQPWLRRKLAAALRVSADELTDLLVRAELLGLEARACAQIGVRDAPDAVRSAEACVEVWHEAEEETAPDWLHYMSQAEVDCLAVNTYTLLAMHDDNHSRWRAYSRQAEFHALRARRTRPTGYDRSRVLDELRLAKVRLSQREPGEALAVATAALSFADAIRSSLVNDWLIGFHSDLVERYACGPGIHQFTDQLRDYLRKVAPAKEDDVRA
jgi:DNA-binding XRE family transcriptional regulator